MRHAFAVHHSQNVITTKQNGSPQNKKKQRDKLHDMRLPLNNKSSEKFYVINDSLMETQGDRRPCVSNPE